MTIAETVAGRTERSTLEVAAIGFFIITLDAVIVNVALPSMRDDLGGGIAGVQWVVDGYTLAFAAFLLTAGAVSDRMGAKRAFRFGLIGFVISSTLCGLAPNLETLVVARFGQGAAAAVMMPSSMALLGQAFPDRQRRARAVGVWSMAGALASSSGPVLGGLLTTASWRLIFFINVPVGVVALVRMAAVPASPTRRTTFDLRGLVLAIVAMGATTFGAIEAGSHGLTSGRVVGAFAVAVVSALAFVVVQRGSEHPMVPPSLVRNREVVVASVVGFAFIVGYYGLPFLMSLFLQQQRGLSSFETGLVFLPMMLVGAALSSFSARVADRLGSHRVIAFGLVTMACGLIGVAVAPTSAPIWAWSALMAIVGLAGPAIMPPTTARLLDRVPADQTGTASGVFNTSRQFGGALSVAVFGTLVSAGEFTRGFRTSLVIAGTVALVAAAVRRSSPSPINATR